MDSKLDKAVRCSSTKAGILLRCVLKPYLQQALAQLAMDQCYSYTVDDTTDGSSLMQMAIVLRAVLLDTGKVGASWCFNTMWQQLWLEIKENTWCCEMLHVGWQQLCIQTWSRAPAASACAPAVLRLVLVGGEPGPGDQGVQRWHGRRDLSLLHGGAAKAGVSLEARMGGTTDNTNSMAGQHNSVCSRGRGPAIQLAAIKERLAEPMTRLYLLASVDAPKLLNTYNMKLQASGSLALSLRQELFNLLRKVALRVLDSAAVWGATLKQLQQLDPTPHLLPLEKVYVDSATYEAPEGVFSSILGQPA